MQKKIFSTQLKLLELSQNSELFSQLVHIHCLFFDKVARPYPHTIDISNNLDCSKGIAQSNLFDQKYFRRIRAFESLENELLDGEEGIFSIQLPSLTLTIIKFREQNQDQTSQKFIVINSLEKFVLRKKVVHDLHSFTWNILDSIRTLLHNDGVWTEQECRAFYKLTRINLSDLIGCPFPEDLASLAKFGRTSNIALAEDNPMDFEQVNRMFPSLSNKE